MLSEETVIKDLNPIFEEIRGSMATLSNTIKMLNQANMAQIKINERLIKRIEALENESKH